MNRFVVSFACLAVAMGAPPTTVLPWCQLQWPPPPPWSVRPTTATLPDRQSWRTEWSTELWDKGPSRPVTPVLLLVISTSLPDRRPSPSQPPLTCPELPRTLLRPDQLLLQPSLPLLLHMLPSPPHQSQLASLLLTLSPRPRSPPP